MTAGPHTGRNLPKEGLDKTPYLRTNLFLLQMSPDQAHPAIDVVPHTPWRDDPFTRIKGRDPPDGKSVAPVDIGHGDRRAHDTREAGDIHDLLDTLITPDTLHEGLIGKEDPLRAHGTLLGNPPGEVIYFF